MRRIYLVIGGIVIIVGVAITILYFFVLNQVNNQASNHSSAVVSPPKSSTDNSHIQHIFVLVDENESSSAVIGSQEAPYLNSLASKYGLATNYSAVSHPSLPNYLALTSGSTDGTTSDCNPPSAGCIVSVTNIADEIETSGRSWKEYAESMPSSCYAYNSGEYATKHNPFVHYSDIINNPARCDSHVVPYSHKVTNAIRRLRYSSR